MAIGKLDTTKPAPINPNASTKVWLFSLLLTLQYGAQPLISKRFTRFDIYFFFFIFFHLVLAFFSEYVCVCVHLAVANLDELLEVINVLRLNFAI